ncbi:MAG: nuclear transport factor 2 family protein [Steroidobacteraceae bacterium]
MKTMIESVLIALVALVPSAGSANSAEASPAASATAAAPAALTSAAAAGAAASTPSPALAAFQKAIRVKYDIKEKAFAAHDAETIVTKFYAEDVISVGEGEGIFVGRDQIRPLYEEVVKSSLVKIDSVHTYVNGNAGWDWADFHVTPTDGKTKPFTFAILFLWSKVHGEWICKGDYFMNGSFRSGKLGATH